MFAEASLLYSASRLSWFRRAWPLTAGLLAAAYAWGLALGFARPAGIAAIAAVFLVSISKVVKSCGQSEPNVVEFTGTFDTFVAGIWTDASARVGIFHIKGYHFFGPN